MISDAWVGCPRAPRAWQRSALEEVFPRMLSGERGLVHVATGCGKTLFTAEVSRLLVERGYDVFVGVPTEMLVRQSVDGICKDAPSLNGKVSAYYGKKKRVSRVTVVCYKSWAAALRAAGPRTRPRAYILDEAHVTGAAGLREDLGEVPADTPVLGLSATPFRVDKSTLDLFSEVWFRYSVADGIRDGVLVPWVTVPWEEEEADLFDAAMQMILSPETVFPLACNARDVAQARRAAEFLSSGGLRAEAVSHETRDPRAVLDRLVSGDLQVVVYPTLLAVGVDVPEIRTLVFLREVGSRVRIVQELGRGIRVAPGKSELVVYDPAGVLEDAELTYDAEVGSAPSLEEVQEEETDDQAWQPRKREEPEVYVTRFSSRFDAWVRSICHIARAQGLVDRKWARSRVRRRLPAKPGFLDTLRRHLRASVNLPEDVRVSLEEAAKYRCCWTYGTVNDAIDVVKAVAALPAPWKMDGVQPGPAPDSIRGYAESLQRSPVVCAVKFDGDRVVAAAWQPKTGRIVAATIRDRMKFETDKFAEALWRDSLRMGGWELCSPASPEDPKRRSVFDTLLSQKVVNSL